MYELNWYKATVVRHVDADTTVVDIDPGFDLTIRKTVRWAGIDAAERFTPEGQAALAYVEQMMPVGSTVIMKSAKSTRDKYGRYLARFFGDNGKPLDVELVEKGWAVAYVGRQ
jgi:endonuclease YncB( thermonuclease family)